MRSRSRRGRCFCSSRRLIDMPMWVWRGYLWIRRWPRLAVRAYPPSMQGKATVIAGAAIVLAGCGGSSQTAVTLTSTLEITKTVTMTAPPPPSVPKTTMETDGTYRVGIDVVQGTYRSAGASPEGASDCYWARLNSLNETHIIDSNISTGPQVVVIQPSDNAFLTHSCQPWQKAD